MGASSSTGSNTWDKRLVRLALLPAFTCNVIHAGSDDEGGHASRRCFEGKFAGNTSSTKTVTEMVWPMLIVDHMVLYPCRSSFGTTTFTSP